ncbi:MAG: LytTR family DNA-binding domain-containing protein [Gammaproteobacteria bacterium]|nr:LytTR family DNA-binding domain-containing protein [Gammaproteobacteria bacterium]
MNTLKTIIVDDESLALDLLNHYLQSYPEIEVVAQCKNGREAIESCVNLQADLLFLDIQMPGLNGFDVVTKLQSDELPMIVFVTAYDQYALAAFDVHAVDYLLKPIDEAKLARAVSRCVNRFRSSGRDSLFKNKMLEAVSSIQKPSLSDATKTLDDKDSSFPKIVVKDRGTITLIDQADIDWIDAAGDYVCIHVDGITHIMRNTMKGIVRQLDPSLFQRIHRSSIVNLSRIRKVIPHTKGECYLDVGNNERIKVSRNYRTIIQDYLQKISE